jgi:cytochrome c oxidase subunit 2
MKTRRKTFVGTTLPLVVLMFSAVSIARPVSDPPDQREIKVTARRFEFSPRTITVSRGERVKLVVTSEDVDHGFAIKEFDIDQAIKAEQTKVIELTPNKEGRQQVQHRVQPIQTATVIDPCRQPKLEMFEWYLCPTRSM